jgi:hypothetical protein
MRLALVYYLQLVLSHLAAENFQQVNRVFGGIDLAVSLVKRNGTAT